MNFNNKGLFVWKNSIVLEENIYFVLKILKFYQNVYRENFNLSNFNKLIISLE